jgi:hypothetical protein
MEIVYVAMSATTATDKNALNAVVEPILMSDMTSVNRTVKITEFVGTRKRSSTRASHLEKTMIVTGERLLRISCGITTSLKVALTNVCRTVDAMRLVSMMTIIINITMVNAVAPALPVLC